MTPSQFVQNNYSEIQNWLRNITSGEHQHLYDDFIHEVIIIFLEHPQAQQAIDSGTARYFLARIGLNQWRSNASPFYYKYKRHTIHSEIKDIQDDKIYDLEDDLLIEIIMMSLDELYQSKDRYEALIIIVYFSMGSNFSEVGRRLNMPPTTIRKIYLRGLKKLKPIINNKLIQLRNGNLKLSNDFNSIISNWNINGSSAEQLPVSIITQLFKTRYFTTDKSVK